MKFSFQVEAWSAALDEMRPLWPLHWEEVALDKALIQPDVDEARYAALEAAGMLHLTTARADHRLAGYVVCFLMPHFHYKSAGLMALADMYFVLPEFRVAGCGAKLFLAMEASLRSRGVVRAHMSCKVEHDHQILFERLGWKFTDKTFGKVLKCQ